MYILLGFKGWLSVVIQIKVYMVSRLGFWVRVVFGSISTDSGGIQKFLPFRGSCMFVGKYLPSPILK